MKIMIVNSKIKHECKTMLGRSDAQGTPQNIFFLFLVTMTRFSLFILITGFLLEKWSDKFSYQDFTFERNFLERLNPV